MSDSLDPSALLILLSSPSGGGKSTLCKRLMLRYPDLRYSVSCTTRKPRGAEQDGVHYHFVSEAEFEAAQQRGEFLESAIVHGVRYGTPAGPVREAMASGASILMAIDVQGAEQIRKRIKGYPEHDPIRRGYVDIFILPPSLAELESRLRSRGEDTDEVIRRRLSNAEQEIKESRHYQHQIVNEDLDAAGEALCAIIERERGTRRVV